MRRPMRKNLFKPAILLAIFALLPLSSCAKLPEKEYTPEEIVESIDDALHSIDTEIEELPADEVDWGEPSELKDVENVDESTSIVYLDDIKLSQAENAISIVDARYKNLPAPQESPSDILIGPELLRLYDENGEDYPLSALKTDMGYGRVALPIEDMWRGHLYHLDLLDKNLCFADKNSSIRSLSLIFEEYAPTSSSTDEDEQNPDDWPIDGLERLDIDIKNFSPEGVYYFDSDSIGLYFIYQIRITGLRYRELFRIGEDEKVNGQWVDDEETFYGHFSSCEQNPNGAGYIVRYEEAATTDIYKETYSAGSKTVDMRDGTIVADHDELREFVLTAEPLRKAAYGIFKYYKVPPIRYRVNALDWYSHLRVTFSTNYDGDAFVFKVGFKLTINPEKHLNISLKGDFTSKTTYDISASAKIEKKWGFLPVGAQFNLKIVEDNVKTWNFGVMFDTSVHPFDKDKATDKITESIDEANNETFPWKSMFSKNSSEGSKTATKDGAKWDLFTIDINYFAPITIRFKLAFYFEANLSFQALIQYSSHTQRVDVSYSTKNKDERAVDAANESKEVQTGALSILFIGKLSIEGGIAVSFGFGFFGLYKYLHAEVIIKAGALLEIVGYMSLNWVWGDHDDGDFSLAIGGKIELSIVLKVSIDVFLISLGYNHTWPIGKWPLIGLANMDSILNWASDYAPYKDPDNLGDDVNIRNGSKLNDLGLFIFTVFSGDDFAVRTVGYKYDYSVKVFYGALIPDSWEVSIDAFTISLEGDYLELENGVFSATNSAPTNVEHFDVIMNVSVADSLGSAKPIKYRLRYHYSAGELVSVSYTHKEGIRKEEAEDVVINTIHHPGTNYTFTLQKNAPLGIVLTGYSVRAYNGSLLIQSYTRNITQGTQTIALNGLNATRYTIVCNYEDAEIHPIYFLGFMGKVIFYKEINHGEYLNLSEDELAELYAAAEDTSFIADIDPDSSSAPASSSSGYVFGGWENWPDSSIWGPLVVRAYYNRVS